MMPITMMLSDMPEEQSVPSATLVIHFDEYIDLFRKVNGGKASPEETSEFNKLKNYLVNKTSNTQKMPGKEQSMSYLLHDQFDSIIEQYEEPQRSEIRQSPAFKNLGDGCHELVKNAIDVFLLDCLLHPEFSETTLQFHMSIDVSEKHVRIIFQDSGPGFPEPYLKKWQTPEGQMAYVNTRIVSDKSKSSVQGLLGGQGLGLRQLMCQSLTTTKLDPLQKAIKPEDFDAEMHFSNGEEPYSGAIIEVITQKAPYVSNARLSSPRYFFTPSSPGATQGAGSSDEYEISYELLLSSPKGKSPATIAITPSSVAKTTDQVTYDKVVDFKKRASQITPDQKVLEKKDSSEAPKTPGK